MRQKEPRCRLSHLIAVMPGDGIGEQAVILHRACADVVDHQRMAACVIGTVGDDADLREVYDTERHLLYVACTRARDHLLVTSVEPASEFLDDMQV